MLQVATIREHRDTILTGLKKRGLNAESLVDEAIRLDDERKKSQQLADELKSKSNAESKRIGELMKNGKADEAASLRAAIAKDKDEIKKAEEAMEREPKLPAIDEALVVLNDRAPQRGHHRLFRAAVAGLVEYG